MEVKSRDLFGGAIVLDLPTEVLDASDLRQIPDNQEVFLFPRSDVTCIVEVLESVLQGNEDGKEEKEADLEAVLRYHFSSLAHDNEAEGSKILSIRCSSLDPTPSSSTNSSSSSSSPPPPTPTPTPSPIHLTGLQRIRKFNNNKRDSELDTVLIHLAVWRLKTPTTNVNGNTKGKDKDKGKGIEIDLVMTWNEPLSSKVDSWSFEKVEKENKEVGNPLIRHTFLRTSASLLIKDWGLFASPSPSSSSS